MLVVSKQRVMRHKLPTDVNLSFSDIVVHTIIYKAQTLVFIYTHHLPCNHRSQLWTPHWLVAAFGWYFIHAPSVVEMLSLCFVSQRFLWFKMQTGQQVAFAVAWSCELMLVPVCSAQFLSFFPFFLMIFFYLNVQFFNVHGDYPYAPNSNWANISETGPQSVSTTGDLQGLLCETWKWFKEGVSFLCGTKHLILIECKSSHHSPLAKMLCMHQYSTSNVWRYWNIVDRN